MIYISEDAVKKLLNWNDTFKATEAAIKNVSKNRAVQNPRTFTNVLDTQNVLLTMPGHLRDEKYGCLGCKLVTMCPNNPQLGLPTINANILIFDENTGVLKAVVAGTEITTWRTAAASAIATKHLKVPEKCKILAILGAGVQGKAHAEAFHHIFRFDKVRIWNHHADKAKKLVDELNGKSARKIFEVAETNKKCVENADVVVTATYATEKIVNFEWLKPGCHINAVGAGPVHHYSELEELIYRNADIYIDHWSGAKKELAGLEALGIKFKGEIGSVINGELIPTKNDAKITVFQSLGMAAEDCAMARMVFDLHQKA